MLFCVQTQREYFEEAEENIDQVKDLYWRMD